MNEARETKNVIKVKMRSTRRYLDECEAECMWEAAAMTSMMSVSTAATGWRIRMAVMVFRTLPDSLKESFVELLREETGHFISKCALWERIKLQLTRVVADANLAAGTVIFTCAKDTKGDIVSLSERDRLSNRHGDD